MKGSVTASSKIKKDIEGGSKLKESSSKVSVTGQEYLGKQKAFLGFRAAFRKDLNGLREQTFVNPDIFIGKEIYQSENQKFSSNLNLNFEIPVEKDSRIRKAMVMSLATGLSLSYRLLKDVKFSYALSYVKNIHRFKTTLDGHVNIRDIINHQVLLDYRISNKFFFQSFFANRHMKSERGTSLSDSFSMGQSVEYFYSKKTSFEIGHVNGGSTYDNFGEKINIDVYDEKLSNFYIAVHYDF